MNLKDATALALIYRKVNTEVFRAYLELIVRLSSEFDMSDAKMIRFENDRKKMTSVCTKTSVNTTTPNPLTPNEDVNVICYQITTSFGKDQPQTTEKGHRYMFYAPSFPEAFSVRLFTSDKDYKKFASSSRITITSELEFRGATLALYKSAGSDVSRVAVFCTDECDLTPVELAKKIEYNAPANTDNVSKTKVFE